MDIRQVALGAAFGAAVAVNAALQSLQDAGSFLIHSPSPGSRSRPVDLLDATTRDARKRPLSFVDDVEEDEDDFDDFKDDDEDEAALSTLDDDELGILSPIANHRHRSKCEGVQFLKTRDEQNTSGEDADLQLEPSTAPGTCAKRRKIEAPTVFMPNSTPLGQTEEAMSLMLQHTTNTVLITLADAKGRRERMMNEMKSVHLPERESSLKLVNSFIDALINVSDSLKIVQSALFVRKDGPP